MFPDPRKTNKETLHPIMKMRGLPLKTGIKPDSYNVFVFFFSFADSRCVCIVLQGYMQDLKVSGDININVIYLVTNHMQRQGYFCFMQSSYFINYKSLSQVFSPGCKSIMI